MDAAQVGKTEWLQIAGHRLDSSSYILSQHDLQGLSTVFYRQGYLAQEEERGTPADLQPLHWQAMGQHAAYVAPTPVADVEYCTVGACEYRARSPELGRGKRRRGAPEEPFLRLLLVQQGMSDGSQMGVWLEHHVHLNLPDFIITRDRLDVSTSLPFLYGQRVKMVWKDAADPARGEWYEGTVSRSQEWGPGLPPGATWEGISVMWDVDRSITHVSPWELVRLPHQQQHQNAQQQHAQRQQQQHAQQHQHAQHQQQHAQQHQQDWPAAGLHNSMQFAMESAPVAPQLHGRPHPLFHPGHAGMEGTRPFVPTVADHPRHLPRLQLRPGGQAAAGKGPANDMGGGVGPGMGHSVASGTSLAEPGSGVSADTPGTLLWGQPGVMPPERAFNGGRNAEAQASQAASQAAALSRPHTADARIMSPPTHIHTDPQISPLSLSPADVPPLFTGLPHRALTENPPFAASEQNSLLAQDDNPRALREDSLAALRSRVSWGLGSGQSLGLSADREEGPDEVEGYQGVTVLPGRAGEHIYMAILRDDNNAEQTCGAFATALDAAKAHDTEALRVYGPAAEAMLNFPMANYPDVLAELQSRRRTNSTDEMDTPASLPDSPWMWELRSQSLTTIAAGLSPSAQRQLVASGVRQTPASGHGSKHRPMKPSHASSSRLAALVDQMPDEREIGASLDGGKRRSAGNRSDPSRASSSQLATAVGNIPLGVDSPSHSPQLNSSRTVSGTNEQDIKAEPEDTDEEERFPAQAAGARRSRRVQKRKGSLQQHKGSAAPAGATTANPDEEDAREGGEEEWAPSPVARGKRNLRVQAGVKKRGGAVDARAAAARRTVTGGRKRSEKLTDFTGVTLKNGRIAVMLWNPVAKKPIHLGYWPSSLAAARMADKARLAADFRRNVKAEDLNFPQAEYSPEELPASIAQLAEFIKEDQGAARRAESMQKAQERGPATRRPANPPARSLDTSKARFSHYLGVSWNKQSQQWQARFHKPDGSSHLVGGFSDEEEAGQAYDKYALKHHGNGAVRNFPPSTYTGKPADDAEAFWRIRQHAANGDDGLSNHPAGARRSQSHRSNAQSRPSTAGTATTASVSGTTVPERPGSVPLHRQAAGQELTSPQTRGSAHAATQLLQTALRPSARGLLHEAFMPAERPSAMHPASEAGEATSQLSLPPSRDALAYSSDDPTVNKEARVSATTKQKGLSLARSLGKSSAVARSLSLYKAADPSQGNEEQRGLAEEGRQHEGKMATAYLARSQEPGSLVQGFSLEEKEAVSALTALQQ